MGFPEPDDDTVAKSARALMKVRNDERVRAQRRATLARETGYVMLAPGMF
ncbi:hypothetical protein HRTV-25_gp51 [Halorubrum tailed virus 25]|uniref:Uncharacterized protein n=1 Tax=Halorubrum tailed virus 25 TaxID=2878006 RepID=A0AAE8XYK0_9CAUD|nr:hypothetical protein M1M37_gp051 [Halorubrum tailed virus 25]UBF22632.1 hypothetical protein HRTV-25_gp51 [Halorubrum tailed virus 25]